MKKNQIKKNDAITAYNNIMYALEHTDRCMEYITKNLRVIGLYLKQSNDSWDSLLRKRYISLSKLNWSNSNDTNGW